LSVSYNFADDITKNDEKLMKQIGQRIILAMFILNGRVLLCGTVSSDKDNKNIVSIQQKDRNTIIQEMCREFRHRIAKGSPTNLYQLPNVILSLVIDFTGNKWRLWSTKQLFSIPRTIAAYGNNSIVIPQEHGVQIVDLTDIDAHCKKFPCSEISQVGPLVVLPDGRVATALVASPVFEDLSFKDRTLEDRRNKYQIDIWNVSSNVVEQQLKGHRNRVRAFAVLSDNRLASGSEDNRVIIWNLSSGEPTLTILSVRTVGYSLLAMPDNMLIIGCHESYQPITLLNCVTGDIVDVVHFDDAVSCLAKLSNTQFAAGIYRQFISGSYSSPIRIWSQEKAKRVSRVRSLCGHTDAITALITLPKDELASASNDGTIRIWDYKAGDCLAILNNRAAIHSLVAMPNGSFLSTSGEKTLSMWKKQRDCAYYEPFQKSKLKTACNFLSIVMKNSSCGIQ
jgi:WD40 repeat protein